MGIMNHEHLPPRPEGHFDRKAKHIAGSLIVLASMVTALASTIHTDDFDMPPYSDPDRVMIATAASGFSIVLSLIALRLLSHSSKIARLFLALLLAGVMYRFVTLVPHFEG
jgi:hypothetical protein